MTGADVNADPMRWLCARDAFRAFATYSKGTQSAEHIKPLHWYVSLRLVLEGGFRPDDLMPRPPLDLNFRGNSAHLSYNASSAQPGERVILGGLKTKSVDVVVTKAGVGPVVAVSCKGVTGAFRNLTNRMEETIGECTNLHITYPAMVMGYFVLLRANRTSGDAVEAGRIESEPSTKLERSGGAGEQTSPATAIARNVTANDIALSPNGTPADGIVRFHRALAEMTSRRGMHNEISRYEAIALVLVEPAGDKSGTAFSGYPPPESPLHLNRFFGLLAGSRG